MARARRRWPEKSPSKTSPALYRPSTAVISMTTLSWWPGATCACCAHLRRPNVALLLGRQGEATGGGNGICSSPPELPTDQNIFRRGGGTVFPLYLYEDESARPAREFRARVPRPRSRNGWAWLLRRKQRMAHAASPRLICCTTFTPCCTPPAYRQRYADFLALDFPRVPLTGDAALFRALSALGARLLRVHWPALPTAAPSPARRPPPRRCAPCAIRRPTRGKRAACG